MLHSWKIKLKYLDWNKRVVDLVTSQATQSISDIWIHGRNLLEFNFHFGNNKLLVFLNISVFDVDSVVIEKPKISADELNELLAEVEQKRSPDKLDKCVQGDHALDDNSEENSAPGSCIELYSVIKFNEIDTICRWGNVSFKALPTKQVYIVQQM